MTRAAVIRPARSLLASIESGLGLARLGYAADAPAIFGSGVFTR